MEREFRLVPAQIREAAAAREIRDCLPVCASYGLALSEAEIKELVSARGSALAATGRVEFGGGVLPKLIRAFCDSPYVESGTWADTLAELQEAFYYYKGEAGERLSDDELIDFMAKVFNGRAQGSAEYLTGTSLAELCRGARNGFDAHDAEDSGDAF